MCICKLKFPAKVFVLGFDFFKPDILDHELIDQALQIPVLRPQVAQVAPSLACADRSLGQVVKEALNGGCQLEKETLHRIEGTQFIKNEADHHEQGQRAERQGTRAHMLHRFYPSLTYDASELRLGPG